ncbi:uncharacterized protein B0I36DRAFT_115412 [Microdochium trichocladiopsis]|uniref:SigF-like NTF2-like domain-containing protein n=1 Tax=Microdochium trichocladiopsis TaxID=1682393 RepID=A0A9P8Y5U7_9PEZI|nr:uncharacterized protein B0I36DRAFT_115412 [Microdochium trichocladiopsis]KAH7030881.1 hypothetical protein B0I36DRAFT_115412 [Microdochium trichocladiopsis]
MEDPTREIESVILSLTQGSRGEQEATLNTYFLPNAYFIHPFCRVPSFAFGGIDSDPREQQVTSPDPTHKLWPLNSRYLVQLVYQWYKILSPSIALVVDSAAFDAKAGLLYVTIRQTFTIWVVPFNLWQAKVKLVSVLELASLPAPEQQDGRHASASRSGENNNSSSSSNKNNASGEVKLEGNDGEAMPSFAQVAAPGPTPAHHNSTFTPSNTMVNGDRPSHSSSGSKKLYYIKGQEDHYQVDQWLKFVSPFGPLWFLWQLFATFLCVLGVAVLWPVSVVVDSRKQRRAGAKDKRG